MTDKLISLVNDWWGGMKKVVWALFDSGSDVPGFD